MNLRKRLQAGAIGGLLAITLAACGGADDGGAGPLSPGDTAPENEQDANRADECALLTESEVTQVIGPNDGGADDMAFGGCRWTASSSKDGFTESVHVAVLTADEYEQLAEIGDPVAGFGDGATYADLHGELWFHCRGDKYCGVKARTAEGESRQGFAEQLAKAVLDRA